MYTGFLTRLQNFSAQFNLMLGVFLALHNMAAVPLADAWSYLALNGRLPNCPPITFFALFPRQTSVL